ncbi:MAG: hypothetical protein ABJA34_06050 [Pseudonocardiales bacterium]
MRSRPVFTVSADLIRAALALGSIGMIAVGISGLLAEAFGALFSRSFVAGDPSGVRYTAARCAEFKEYAPTARTCAEAATTHHFGEVVEYRVAAGVLGVIGLGIWWLLRRRARPAGVLPEAFEATVATALFAVAATGLLLQSFGLAVIGGESNGVGGLLSAGLVAAVAAVVFGVVLWRALLSRAEQLRAA